MKPKLRLFLLHDELVLIISSSAANAIDGSHALANSALDISLAFAHEASTERILARALARVAVTKSGAFAENAIDQFSAVPSAGNGDNRAQNSVLQFPKETFVLGVVRHAPVSCRSTS